MDRSQYPHSAPCLIANDVTGPRKLMEGAVRPHHAVFKRHIGALLLQRATLREQDRLTIVRMHKPEQFALSATGRTRRHAEECVDLRRPVELTDLQVPVPDPYRCLGQGEAGPGFTGSEFVFDTLPFGNVGGDAAGRVGFAGVVAERKFDRDIRVRASA
jgi:hypothetical protein